MENWSLYQNLGIPRSPALVDSFVAGFEGEVAYSIEGDTLLVTVEGDTLSSPTISGRSTPDRTLSNIIIVHLTNSLGELKRVGRGRYQRLK